LFPPGKNSLSLNAFAVPAGNHVDLRGLPGGAKGIRTDGHRRRIEFSSYSRLPLRIAARVSSAPVSDLGRTIGPNRFQRNRPVPWLMSIQRQKILDDAHDSGYHAYIITTRRRSQA
jgi:hypothetical protein